eukprot:XP_024465015.1 stress-response A/B barrel domain-containing protein HS1 isoform X2 [Populus trichocarpa]
MRLVQRKKNVKKASSLVFKKPDSFSASRNLEETKTESKRERERERERDTVLMEEAKGVVKHVLLAKFKEGIPSDEIEKLIKGYANLVNLIEPMKAFEWGTDVSIENMHQGFTHIFESTCESKEGIAEYIGHPAHVDFGGLFLPALEKVIVFDYKPTVARF